jgi:rhodanese-related sulfurtransferase
VAKPNDADSPVTLEIDDMTPAQVDSLIAVDSTSVLLDVRTAPEFVGSTGHLKGAVLIPVQELESRMNELEPYRGRTIVVYCRIGVRSRHATQIMRDWGFTAFNMTGGMLQWNAEKRPAVRENKE